MRQKLLLVLLAVCAMCQAQSMSEDAYEQLFVDRFGAIDSWQNWNMAVSQTLSIHTTEPSKVVVFGTKTSELWGSRKLAVFENVSGQQTLVFDRPKVVKNLYVMVSNNNYTRGFNVSVDQPVVDVDGIDTGSFNLGDCVSTEYKNIPVDQYALSVLPNGRNNSGKVTQSSQYISDGTAVTVTPVYSDCGYSNTFGIYIQKGNSVSASLDLWTKTSNHTSGTAYRPEFTILLPAGTVYGFYIRNGGGTYYSDASLNRSQARSAGVFQGENCFYLAFEDMPLSGDMDYNDMVFKVKSSSQILDNDPSEWTIAAEIDEGEDCDFDFNDVVFKFSYVKGEGRLRFIPLAAGTKQRVEVYFNDALLGEMHELLRSSQNTFVNVIDNGKYYMKPVTEYPFNVNVPNNFAIADDMGGFTIKVGGRTIHAPESGKAPRMLLISSGDWRWLTEKTPIDEGYPEWTDDPDWGADDNVYVTDGDNTDTIEQYEGESVTAVLRDRTLHPYKWNTLCLPFDATMEQIQEALGEEADVEELVSSTWDEEALLLTLYFTPRTSIVAGKPYVVKVREDIEKPTFKDVTIENVNPETITTTYCSMTGVLNATALTPGDKNTLFIQNNHFYYPISTSLLPATRCYFSLEGDARQAKRVTLMQDNMLDGISDVISESPAGDGTYYTLQGIKTEKPQRGIYIVNGKKVVVK